MIIISLFQPWWMLNSSSDDGLTEKTSSMFIFSQTMIDRISYEDEIYLDIATIPEEFTEFLGILLIIITTGIFLMGISFIPNVSAVEEPEILDVYPSDEDANYNPQLSVKIHDYQEDYLTVIFKTNATISGLWETIGTYYGGNDEYTQNTSNMNIKDQLYYWT